MGVKRILVVDDEKPISLYLKKKLEKLGYSVTVAEDGKKAISDALSQPPDLILLDVMLPELNGIDVCRRLKSEKTTKAIPIIMLSAKAQGEEIEKGLEAGADKYLCKPISFPDILNEIKAYE